MTTAPKIKDSTQVENMKYYNLYTYKTFEKYTHFTPPGLNQFPI